MLSALATLVVAVGLATADRPHHGGHHGGHHGSHHGGHHGIHHGSHHQPAYGKGHPAPYGHCDSTVAPACAGNGSTYCLEDVEYPTYEIKGAISKDYLIAKKYSDVPEQSADDLVQSVTKEQEEGFDYSFYTGASTGDSPYDLTHWSGPEGYLCPSDVAYAKPLRAVNVEGKWRVIVNDIHYYTQTARLETCLFPLAACRALAPCYQSHCTQKFIYHRMLSYDPCDPYRGLFIDTYKLPSACSCLVNAD